MVSKVQIPCAKGQYRTQIKDDTYKYGYKIKVFGVIPDHIHIFLDYPQIVAPCDIVKTLKSMSAVEMFKAFPQLKQVYTKCGVLWSRGYFISTVGHISASTVIKYIEEQKNHD